MKTCHKHLPGVRCGSRGRAFQSRPEGFPIIKSLLSQFYQYSNMKLLHVLETLTVSGARCICKKKFFNSKESNNMAYSKKEYPI